MIYQKKLTMFFYIIIGDGDDKRRLELKAKKLKVDHLILFLGNISEKKKAYLFIRACYGYAKEVLIGIHIDL